MQTDRRTDSERTSQRGVTERSAVRTPENGHSQEQSHGVTPEDVELLAEYPAARPWPRIVPAMYRDPDEPTSKWSLGPMVV